MQAWLLLLQKNDTGEACELIADDTIAKHSTAGLKNRLQLDDITLDLSPEVNDALHNSAQIGAQQSYMVLWRSGAYRLGGTVRFKLNAAQDLLNNVDGHSGDLLFALATATVLLNKTETVRPFAATGSLTIKQQDAETSSLVVQKVDGVAAKLQAVLAVIPKGGIIFYPAGNQKDIDASLHEQATQQGIELCAIDHLHAAIIKLLGVELKFWDGNPYRGLHAFTYEHRCLYFGRQAQIDQCQQQFAEAGYSRLLILGSSGSGKSSFVQAGLMPRLEQQVTQQGKNLSYLIWRVSQTQASQSQYSEADLARSLARQAKLLPADNFSTLLQQLPINTTEPTLWFIDQFEELFTLCQPELLAPFEQFLQQLSTHGIGLIASLRNDFYSAYQTHFSAVFLSQHRYDLPPLSNADLEQIIQSPADLADIRFEESIEKGNLANRLRDEAKNQTNVLPLLEFCLAQLYEQRDSQSRQLTHAVYENMGGLQKIISERAEQIFHTLTTQTQSYLTELLWQVVVFSEGEKINAQPATINRANSPEPLSILIDTFVKARLLVSEHPTDLPQHSLIRVSHETLLTDWQRAKDLIDNFQADKRLYSRLSEQALLWQKANEDPSRLLVTGLPLLEAKNLQHRYRHSTRLEPLVIDFIEISNKVAQRKKRLFWTISSVVLTVIISFAGVSYWQWQEAERQRLETKHNFDKAVRLVNEFYTEVSENTLLNQPKMELVRKKLLEKALKYYEEFSEQHSQNPDLQADLAKAIFRLGNIKQLLGNTLEAKQAYRHSIELLESLINNTNIPNNVGYKNDLSTNYNNLATLQEQNGDTQNALELHQKAINIRKQLVDDYPNISEYKGNLADSYNNLALTKRELGNTQDAQWWFQEAIKIHQKLVQDYPDTLQYKLSLAKEYTNLAIPQEDSDNKDSAHNSYLEAIKILEPLAKTYPNVTDYQSLLAMCYNNIGSMFYQEKKDSEAKIWFYKTIERRKLLFENHPDVLAYQADLAMGYNNLASIKSENNDYNGALADFQETINIYKKLSETHPELVNFQFRLSTAYRNFGGVKENIKDYNAARIWLEKSKDIVEKLVNNFPEKIDYQDELAQSYFDLAVLENNIKNNNDAHYWYQKSIDIYLNLGKLQNDKRDKHSAQMYYKKAIDMAQQLASAYPFLGEGIYYHNTLANIYNKAGELEKNNSNIYQARIWYEKATNIYKQLATLNPRTFDFLKNLSDSYNVILNLSPDTNDEMRAWFQEALNTLLDTGNFLGNTGDDKNAQAWFLEAKNIGEQLIKAYPDTIIYQEQLVSIYDNLGFAQHTMGDENSALTWHKKAVDAIEHLVQEHPNQTRYKSHLAAMLSHLSFIQLFTHHPKETITTATRALEFDPSQTWIKINLAHGLLFDGQYHKALILYRAEDGKIKLPSGRTYAEAVLDDFKQFRAKGINHPDMIKIETFLNKS